MRGTVLAALAAGVALSLAACAKEAPAAGEAKPQAEKVAPAQGEQTGAAEAAAAAPAEAQAQVAAAGEPACGGQAAGKECGSAEKEGCAGEHGTEPIAHPNETTTKDPATGASVTVVGAALAGTEVVRVKDLLEKPEAYAGKTVRLEGNVSAMCTHRRGWFAVVDDGDRTGAVVRVLTAPAFLVPDGSIGRKARTEGTVEVQEVPAAAARHYAQDHKVGDGPAEGAATIKQVVVRANGAEFL